MTRNFKNCSLKLSNEEYISLRNLHTEVLKKGINITLNGVIQSCIDIVSQEGIKEEYFKFFDRNKKKI